MSMSVLRGHLCLCLANPDSMTVWVMEEYGVQESWKKLVKFRKAERCSTLNYVCTQWIT
ncbi:OLC1v1000847C2 [Oldenlandia corymbosa var. corymbosa]|nr:OLC1v1000847C2 [Oldenlandia corymbosa var. corymbosa]